MMPCCAMLCYAMLCYAVLCYAMLCYAMLCCTIPCCAVPCFAMLCHAMLCYAMLCYAMLCYAMLCYAMLCYAMLCGATSCAPLPVWRPRGHPFPELQVRRGVRGGAPRWHATQAWAGAGPLCYAVHAPPSIPRAFPTSPSSLSPTLRICHASRRTWRPEGACDAAPVPILCYAMLRHATPCYAMLRHDTPCYAPMPCYAMQERPGDAALVAALAGVMRETGAGL
jgi:hypothetical protein